MCVRLPVLSYLILTDEFLVRDVCGQIRVQESTESQAVTPTAAEVGHIDVLREERNTHRLVSHGDKELKKLIRRGLDNIDRPWKKRN